MTHSKILLVALQEELPTPPDGYKIVYTGVGKVNAAFAATQAIAEAHSLGFHPEVYNYGTVGSCNKGLSGMHRVTRFIQRDMNAEPQAPRGTTPFDNSAPYIDFNHDTHSSNFAPAQTKVLNNRLVRVLSWYDNEWGFSCRMADTAIAMGKLL